MNKFILVALLLPLFSIAQKDSIPKNADGRYEYTEVVNVDSASAEKLYSNAKLFVATTFKSGKSVTQLNDDNTKTVVGHGAMSIEIKIIIGPPIFSNVVYTFTIQCKDNKYKYSIGDFILEDQSGTQPLDNDNYWLKNKSRKKILQQIKEQVNKNTESLISMLKKSMAAETDHTKDW